MKELVDIRDNLDVEVQLVRDGEDDEGKANG